MLKESLNNNPKKEQKKNKSNNWTAKEDEFLLNIINEILLLCSHSLRIISGRFMNFLFLFEVSKINI